MSFQQIISAIYISMWLTVQQQYQPFIKFIGECYKFQSYRPSFLCTYTYVLNYIVYCLLTVYKDRNMRNSLMNPIKVCCV